MDTTPTLSGFITFCRNVVGIPVDVMPDNDPGFQSALDYAALWIPLFLNQLSPGLFTVCTYNWAASLLIQYQQDPTGQVFFTQNRQSLGINNFVPGVLQSASNEATSQSMAIGKGLSNMTITDMQRVKDPYGRQALAILMDLGTVWGLT